MSVVGACPFHDRLMIAMVFMFAHYHVASLWTVRANASTIKCNCGGKAAHLADCEDFAKSPIFSCFRWSVMVMAAVD
jgi:hypothetical protein